MHTAYRTTIYRYSCAAAGLTGTLQAKRYTEAYVCECASDR